MQEDLDPEQSRRRRARREFIRTHHPDVGGEHDAFVAGLAGLDDLDAVPDARPTPSTPGEAAIVIAEQPWPVSITTGFLRRVHRRKRRPRVR